MVLMVFFFIFEVFYAVGRNLSKVDDTCLDILQSLRMSQLQPIFYAVDEFMNVRVY